MTLVLGEVLKETKSLNEWHKKTAERDAIEHSLERVHNEAGRCRLTVSNPQMKARTVSTISA